METIRAYDFVDLNIGGLLLTIDDFYRCVFFSDIEDYHGGSKSGYHIVKDFLKQTNGEKSDERVKSKRHSHGQLGIGRTRTEVDDTLVAKSSTGCLP